MRVLARKRGFTLVELIATVTIISILAAIALPRVIAANPFQARGYGDEVAANLRKARAVAIATDCDVQFTIDDDGYRALQRAAAGGHCASAGGFSTPVLQGAEPADVTLTAARQFTFAHGTGAIGAAVTIDLGYRTVTLEASGILR
jgi:prepilin-type N-terminal cleavage/methylation domain-containing protein